MYQNVPYFHLFFRLKSAAGASLKVKVSRDAKSYCQLQRPLSHRDVSKSHEMSPPKAVCQNKISLNILKHINTIQTGQVALFYYFVI